MYLKWYFLPLKHLVSYAQFYFYKGQNAIFSKRAAEPSLDWPHQKQNFVANQFI